MGGNEAHNDWTSTGAEFNFYCDPDAAEEVITKVPKRICDTAHCKCWQPHSLIWGYAIEPKRWAGLYQWV